LEFIPSDDLEMDIPKLILSDPFLINKNSSSKTILDHISERIDLMIDLYYLDDTILQPFENSNKPIIIIKYVKTYIH